MYVGNQNQIDTRVGTIASVAFGAAFAHTSKRAGELSNYLDMADDLPAEHLHIEDGKIFVRDVPGVGTAIDDDKLAYHRNHWVSAGHGREPGEIPPARRTAGRSAPG